MKTPLCWLLGGLLTWIASGTANAFVGVINSRGEMRRWALSPTDSRVRPSSVNPNTRAIIYRLDSAGYSTNNTAAELDAVRSAFDQWQAVSGTYLKFEEGPPVTGVRDVKFDDHTNTVFWSRSLLINGQRDSLSGLLALTYVAAFSNGNIAFDADLVFNGVEVRWFTDHRDPSREKIFVEGIALHEVGHMLRLEHSPVGGATMLVAGQRGVNAYVGLSADEVAAAQALYGTSQTLGSLGRVSGRVTASTDRHPVLGAVVQIEDAQGNVRGGTVTWTNGTYELPALSPGPYTVRVTPLDPLFAPYFLVRGPDIGVNPGADYTDAETSFVPAAPRTVSVTAGGRITADFEVTPGSPLRVIRLLVPASDLAQPEFVDWPVSVQPAGQTIYLGVLTSSTLTGEVDLEIGGDGWTPGPIEVRPDWFPGLSLVARQVTVAPGATPGLRNIRLRAGNQEGWANGFLEVLPPFPDVNADGLDDRFQRDYWGPRFTVPASAPTADPDQDGFDNRWEFETGSVPTNKLSAAFRIESVRITAAGATVLSQTAKGKRFQLYGRDSVPGADWQKIGSVVTAAGATTEFKDPTATTASRFYRVELQP